MMNPKPIDLGFAYGINAAMYIAAIIIAISEGKHYIAIFPAVCFLIIMYLYCVRRREV